MRKYFKYILFIVGAIGWIAVPEDLNKWLKTLGINMDIASIEQSTIRWIIFGICMFAVIVSSDVYKKILHKKLTLQIGFDLEKFPGYLDDTSNAYEDPQTGKTVRVAFSQLWRIFVYNPSSTETIKNVEVKLIDINKCLLGSARNLPEVHLKFTHDNKREQRFTDIHPKSRKFVDVIECYMKSTQINENIFYVQHIEKNENYSDLSLFFKNIDKEDCKIRIEAEGENITCKPKDFIISLKNDVINMWQA